MPITWLYMKLGQIKAQILQILQVMKLDELSNASATNIGDHVRIFNLAAGASVQHDFRCLFPQNAVSYPSICSLAVIYRKRTCDLIRREFRTAVGVVHLLDCLVKIDLEKSPRTLTKLKILSVPGY